VDADRARLLAIGERREQISELGVGAMRGDEPFDVMTPVPAAPLADNGERVGSRTSDRVREPSRGMVSERLKLAFGLALH
jgi:hypothetical protein